MGRWKTLAALLLAWLAALWLCPALPARAEAELTGGALAEIALSEEPVTLDYTPSTNSVYGVYLFPASPDADVRLDLYQGERFLVRGDDAMPALTMRLTAGITYTLKLTGSGSARVEVAREALSRCFGQPMPLDGEYAKVIARPGDAHWYRLEPGFDGPLLALASPQQPGLRLSAQLFDGEGRLLDSALSTRGGACLLNHTPAEGQALLLRICAADPAMTGLYDLRLAPGGDVPARSLSLSPARLTLAGRESAVLTALLQPEGAGGTLYWESADPSVALVNQEGAVAGLRAGATRVRAYAPNGVWTECAVTVEDVRVTQIALAQARLDLRVGDEVPVDVGLRPANALDQRVSLSTADPAVAEVSDGMVYALSEGETTLTVTSLGSGVSASMPVAVGPAVRHYRALLIGEENYASTVAEPRAGTAQTLSALEGMLDTQRYDGATFQRVRALLDPSRDQALAAIRRTFGKARDGDLSLLYITCHGEYADGMTRLRMVDGSVLTAAELARALMAVRGEVAVLIDCCGSSGAIGSVGGTGDILSGIDQVFQGALGGAPLRAGRFHVLASASLEQDSYRLRYTLPDGGQTSVTLFAMALCEAGGWDLIAGARSSMRADRNFDGKVTMAELYGYLSRRVCWTLNQAAAPDGTGPAQTVRLWPETDAATLFARTAARENAGD